MFPIVSLASERSAARVAVVQRTDPERLRLERFIHRRFAEHYGAHVSDFLPVLLGIFDARRRIQAALGLCGCGSGALFLEHYLDRPVEAELTAQVQQPVARTRIVEIGNLACSARGATRALVCAMADYLLQSKFEWIACTMGPYVANTFRRLGLPLLDLGPAERSRLPAAERERWGSYYAQQPRVMAGRIRDAARILPAPRTISVSTATEAAA